MRLKVEEELNRLTKEGIIEPIQFSDWVAPIVQVVKNDKSIRICGDFKMTINQVSKLDRYPIPRIEDLFAKLSGGQHFTKLDLSQAHLQLLLDVKSREVVAINTHRGLFRYNRLPFGIPKVVVYLDDILISGVNEEDHLSNLEEVLQRVQEAGLKLKREKCKFMMSSVTYLGHRIDAQGLHPLPEKVTAIQDAPRPRTVMELKSFLGFISYYGKFMPKLSTVLSPLYELLKASTKWRWSDEEEEAFLSAITVVDVQ